MAALIHIEQLSRHYGERPAVAGIGFELQAGEVLGFLGPNGAGKSTTMQMISGVIAPDSGSIRIDGIDLLREPIRAKRALGYLPENPPLYPEMRVDEYLAYCARLHRMPRPQIGHAVQQVKQRCGLEQVGSRVIDHLSKGYRQRVGIAQAIIHQPRVIILDEPTSGLDPNQIQQIRHLVRELADDCAILLSTHILPEVQSLCDRVLILNQGRLVYSGRVAEQSRALLVTLGRDDDGRQLARLPGVAELEPLDRQRFRLILQPETPVEEISRAIIESGCALHGLQRDQDSLERIFGQVTLGEAAA
ncbi:MAG: ABC transporter ATP-binding protein [Sedimenticola sp.]|nr:ABC transporter ATP-binding protein [Sedimenticola sp.]